MMRGVDKAAANASRVAGEGRAPAPAEALLCAEGLAVGYGKEPVVAEVDLELHPGDVAVLIGPNGAGKSTLLKTIAAQLEPLGGAVYVSGRPLAELSPRERALQLSVMLTQRLRTELLTCEDVVEAGRYPHTGRLGVLSEADHAAVHRAMELLDVWSLRERDFMQVSDGQRQRVLIARALCQQPQVLVLDEPTGYLDIRYQIELLDVLRGLAASGELGMVMSLHELALARQVATHVVCVKDGRVCAQGTPEEIFVPQVIDALFDLKPGSYDPQTGAIRLDGLSHARLQKP